MDITPKNWAEFQHYKNRCPPWIKLYRKLLDDEEWHCLPDASKALAIMLWLLASEHENASINADHKALAFRLRTTPEKIRFALKPLIDAGFFFASTMLAGCKQDAIPETERETETEERQTIARSPLRGNGSDPTPVVEKIPLNDGTEFEVHQSLVSEYDRLYPAVDIAATLREMRGWALANPAKRKTIRGVNRFINSWLAREQDKNG